MASIVEDLSGANVVVGCAKGSGLLEMCEPICGQNSQHATYWTVVNGTPTYNATGMVWLRSQVLPGASNNHPNLQRFALDLTKLARLGRLEKVVGYDAEVAKTLSDSTKTPVLIGESNLDRTAIARGLALRIDLVEVPAALRKQLFSLNLNAIAANAKTSQEFENCVQAIIGEAEKANGQIILFIDELQEFAGKRATYIASSALRTALRDRGLRVIGAASPSAV
ncbi:MAG TPA: AAA family ATPase [Pyrinomonadaceae bacterium]|nr:AAA family ATPase [Pyrinomonadaceae bacterium]